MFQKLRYPFWKPSNELSLDSHELEDINNELYDQSMKRLYMYRMKLCVKVDKINKDLVYYNDYKANFQQKYTKAKKYVEECEQYNEYNLIPVKLDQLIAQVVIKKRAKLIAKLFKIIHNSINLVDSLCTSIRKDYQKSHPSILCEEIKNLQINYVKIINVLNIYLLIQINQESTLYRYFYEYMIESIDKLNELLREIFIWSFDLVKWPVLALEHVSEPISDHVELFCQLFKFLLELETGDFKMISNNLINQFPLFNKNPTFNKPLQLMVEPLLKRFHYYFLNPNSKLNNIEKPEWYLCQVEQWITRNEPFLINYIDPILQEYFGDSFKSSKNQVIRSMLEIIQTRLKRDKPQSMEDRIFGITAEELIIFNKQINFIEPYFFENNPDLNPLSIFFDDRQNYNRFIQIEKNKLNHFIESIFESETSWSMIHGSDDNYVDQFLVCEAADQFAMLIQNLFERSTYIPHKEYQMKVMDLIIEILDDIRLRLSQLIHDYNESWPFSQKFFSILNTFDFLLILINNLNPNSMDLSTINYKIACSRDNELQPDFSKKMSNLSEMFKHMIDEIFERIMNVIISEFLFDLQEYKKLKWHGMSVDENNIQVTKPGAILFFNVSTKINMVKKYCSSNLFTDFVFDIASKIQNAFYDHFISKQDFNKDGIKQLGYDIKHGLFIIFSMYMKHVEYTFSKISDCLVLLNFSPQTYHNLRVQYKIASEMEFRVYLKTLGIYSLKASTVMTLMNKRIGFN